MQYFKTLLFIVLTAISTRSFNQSPEPAIIKVDLSKDKGPMKPIWAWFGYEDRKSVV